MTTAHVPGHIGAVAVRRRPDGDVRVNDCVLPPQQVLELIDVLWEAVKDSPDVVAWVTDGWSPPL